MHNDPAFMNCRRLGIMGGTFDPIHNGHLLAAENVRETFDLDRVLFIPTGNPVFKLDKQVTDGEDRFEMVRLAIENNPAFGCSRLELDREGVTYTVDTVEALKNLCAPHTELYFITGTDAAQALLKWKDAKRLLSMCTFVTIGRPGYDKESFTKESDRIFEATGHRLQYFEAPALEISSSQLRERMAAGRSLRYLVPDAVANYIQSHGLYKK